MNNFVVNSFQMPNALVDELLSKLSGSELKCYLVIVRKTKGWNKLEDAISISQFEGLTGLSNRAIIDACKKLENYGLIESKKGYRNTAVYMCKNFTCEEKSHMNKTTTTCEQNDISPVKKVHTQNNTNTKYTNTKDNKENTKEKSTPKSQPQKPYSDEFEKWWEIYPRKSAKGGAYKIWKKEKLDKRIDELIKKLTQQNAMQFAFTDPQFIPYPSTYLNEARYDDEVQPVRIQNEANKPTHQLSAVERVQQTVARSRAERAEKSGNIGGNMGIHGSHIWRDVDEKF